MKKRIKAGALLAAVTIVLAGCSLWESPAPSIQQKPGSGSVSEKNELSSSEIQQQSSLPSGESSVPVSSEPEAVPEDPTEELPFDTAEYDITPYKELLDNLWLVIGGHVDMELCPEGGLGVWEAAGAAGSPEAAAEIIGYRVTDVTRDGTPELLVGAVDGGEASFGSNLYAVYTLTEEGPYCVLSGWNRNAYYLTGSGFFYSGSSGAAYSIFGRYILSADGLIPLCTDYYFSKEKDAEFTEIGYYYNNTGYWDPTVSKEMDEEAFWAKHDEMAAGICSADLRPFSGYEFTGEIPEPVVSEPAVTEGPEVSLHWEDGQLQYYPDFASFAADRTEYGENVLLCAENDAVRDVRVLELEFTAADEDEFFFTTKELFYLEELTVDRPLLLRVSFPGSIPLYGISYTGADGETVYRSMNMSGMDGSLYLSVFSPME